MNNGDVSGLTGAASRTLQDHTLEQTRLDLTCFLFSANASWMLLAFIIAQTYTYSRRWQSDHMVIRVIVYGLLTLQCWETVADTFSTYFNLVSGWGDPTVGYTGGGTFGLVTSDFPVLSDVLCGIVVQTFFITRIWIFARTIFGSTLWMLVLHLFVGALAILSFGAGLSLFIIYLVATSFEAFQHMIDMCTSIWTISSAVTDTIITISMIAILRHAKSITHFRQTRDRLSKVIRATIQTGFITALLAISIPLLLHWHHQVQGLYTFPWYFIGKSYVISLLSILNARVDKTRNSVVGGSAVNITALQSPPQLSSLAFAPGVRYGPASTPETDAGSGNRTVTSFIRSLVSTFTEGHGNSMIDDPESQCSHPRENKKAELMSVHSKP